MRATTVVALSLSAAVPALSAPLLPLHSYGPLRMGHGPVVTVSKPVQARELTDLLARDVQAGSGAFGWGSLIKDGAEVFGDLFGGSSNSNNNNRREIEELLAREPLSLKPNFWIDHGPELGPELTPSQLRTRELDELLARDVQAGSGAFGWGSLIKDGAEVFGDLFGGSSSSSNNNNNKREVEELLARNLYIDGRTIYTGPGPVRVNWADLPKRELEELLARDVQDGSGAFGWGSIIKDGAEIFGDLFGGSSSSSSSNQNNRREEVVGQLLARQAQSQQGSGAFGWGSIVKDGAEIFGDLFGGSNNNNQNNRRELIELLTREVEAQQGSGAFGWGTIIKDGAEILGDVFDGSSNNNNNNN